MLGTIESNLEKTIEKMEAQFKVWNAVLGQLIARGKVASQEAKIESRQRVDEFKAQLDLAQAKLAEVHKAGTRQWESLRAGVDNALKQAEAAFKRLLD